MLVVEIILLCCGKVILHMEIIFLVNLKKSLNTANRNTGDVFADFDAITSGLLGGTDVNGSEVKATATSQEHNFDKPFFHQSHHSNKQR